MTCYLMNSNVVQRCWCARKTAHWHTNWLVTTTMEQAGCSQNKWFGSISISCTTIVVGYFPSACRVLHPIDLPQNKDIQSATSKNQNYRLVLQKVSKTASYGTKDPFCEASFTGLAPLNIPQRARSRLPVRTYPFFVRFSSRQVKRRSDFRQRRAVRIAFFFEKSRTVSLALDYQTFVHVI